MRNPYKQFEEEVQSLSNPKDFEQNRGKLKELSISSYSTFKKLLKLGGEIIPSMKASDEIFRISQQTALSETELVELSMRFRMINGIIDEKLF